MSHQHYARNERFGGFLDDYVVGDVYHHWPGKTITESDNHLFCLLTLAASPVHVDANYARESVTYQRNLVVGTYIYSLLLGMSVPDISGRAIASLGVETLTHLAPVFHGDTIYGHTEILEVRPSTSKIDRGVLRVATTGVNQGDEPVCTFIRSVMLPRRQSEGAS